MWIVIVLGSVVCAGKGVSGGRRGGRRGGPFDVVALGQLRGPRCFGGLGDVANDGLGDARIRTFGLGRVPLGHRQLLVFYREALYLRNHQQRITYCSQLFFSLSLLPRPFAPPYYLFFLFFQRVQRPLAGHVQERERRGPFARK